MFLRPQQQVLRAVMNSSKIILCRFSSAAVFKESEDTKMSGTTAVAINRAQASKTRRLVQIAVLGAIAAVLMLFEFPLPVAPPFYKFDFSEVPIMIGGFAMGPIAGVLIELIKVVINTLLNGTSTMFVGELGNLIIGCAMVVPAALIYKKLHSRKGAHLHFMPADSFSDRLSGLCDGS